MEKYVLFLKDMDIINLNSPRPRLFRVHPSLREERGRG